MKNLFSLLVVFIFCCFVFSTIVYADFSWTVLRPTGDVTQEWNIAALSSDGSTMLAGVLEGRLYISTNGGSTWNETQPGGNIDQNWAASGMSTDGQTILVGSSQGRLYRSINGGNSWNEIQLIGDVDGTWETVAVSSTGQYMVAAAYGGRVYISTDSGANWSETRPAGNTSKDWQAAAISADGQTILTAVYEGRMYKTTNGGGSWTETQPGGNSDYGWWSINITPNGQSVIAGALTDRVYISSNGGGTWTETRPAGDVDLNWGVTGITSNGQTMLAAAYPGNVYLTTNGGSSWSETKPNGDAGGDWNEGAMSSEGIILLTYWENNLYTTYQAPSPSSSSNQSSNVTNNTTQAPSCNDTTPTGTPNLFQIDAAGTYVNLYFRGVKGSNGYHINYDLTPNANQYGDNFGYPSTDWVVGRTISGLSPNTTYYFRVQAANGCTAGNWSNVVSVKTKSYFANITQWFANLAGNKPQLPSSSPNSNVLGVSTASISGCSYTVQTGDSLWNIAQRKWGKGSKYSEILSLNANIKLLIRPGQTIQLCN